MRGKRRRGAPEPQYRELDLSMLKMSLPHTVVKRGIEFTVQQTNGKSAEEAGAPLGLSAGATRVVLHRAMRRLSGFAERMMK